MSLDVRQNALSGVIPSSYTALARLGLHNWHVDLGENSLRAEDSGLRAYLAVVDPDWATTQTVAPHSLQVSCWLTDTTELSWSPIAYAADGGYYEVASATYPGGPYTVHGITADKTVGRYTISDVPAGLSFWVVRSHTPAHGEQQNALWSDWGQEIHLPPPDYRPALYIPLVDTRTNENRLYSIALEPPSPATVGPMDPIEVHVHYYSIEEDDVIIQAYGMVDGVGVGGNWPTWNCEPGLRRASTSFRIGQAGLSVDTVRVEMWSNHGVERLCRVDFAAAYDCVEATASEAARP